jgi:hypothetical protein
MYASSDADSDFFGGEQTEQSDLDMYSKRVPSQLSLSLSTVRASANSSLGFKQMKDNYFTARSGNQQSLTARTHSGPSSKKIDEWMLERELILKAREEERRRKEKEQQAECTFKPKIISNPQRSRRSQQESVDSLYNDHKRRTFIRTKSQEVRKALDAESTPVKRVPFPPTASKGPPANYRGLSYTAPFLDRCAEFAKEREKRKEEMRQKFSQNSFPFHPTVCETSQKIVEKLGLSVEPVEDRLYDRRKILERDFPEDERQRCLSVQPISEDFLNRQSAFNKAKEINRYINDRDLHKECTFKPMVTLRSEAILATRGRYTAHNADEVVNRLGVDNVEEKRRKAELVREHLIAAECTFHPKINIISEVLSANKRSLTPVHDRLYNEPTRPLRPSSPKVNDSSFISTKSEIVKYKNPLYENVQSQYNLSQPEQLIPRINALAAKKEESLQKIRDEKMQQTFQECTFGPRIRHLSRPHSAKAVLVPGLDRFLELKKLSEFQKTDMEMRKLKIYGNYSSKSLAITVPEPFNLSTGIPSQRPRSYRGRSQ